MQDYAKTYDHEYHKRADGYAHWLKWKLRYGDALAAIAYAFGVSSWEKIREVFPITPLGKESDGDQLTVIEQLEGLRPFFTRTPKSVLDIGGGRGEVAISFVYLNVGEVQSVEPHADALAWYVTTAKRLFNFDGIGGNFRLVNGTCPQVLPYLELDNVDTVLFVESIEHIPIDAFNLVWEKVKEALVRNKGRLVITNWLDYHPLEATGEEHCRRIDDAVYDELAQDGKVVYRNGSHIVIDF